MLQTPQRSSSSVPPRLAPGFPSRRSRPWNLALALVTMLALAPVLTPGVLAQGSGDGASGETTMAEPAAPAPEEQLSITRHTVTVDGEPLAYTATAGNYIVPGTDGEPLASIFFVAYTKDDGEGDDGAASERPVTFSFNGGPGAAAVWVHLGAFGPWRVAAADAEGFAAPPPGRLVPNDETILDVTDLVFIDPLSTCWSRPMPGVDPRDYHGVEKDVELVGDFIRLWLTRNDRWASPKFLAGESYGTTRSAGLARYLQEVHGAYLNGVVMISTTLTFAQRQFVAGNDLPYLIYLPSYAVTAGYHGMLAPELAELSLDDLMAEVEEFALTDYAVALHKGDRLTADERRSVLERLARYTGLSEEFLDRADLRVNLDRFRKELLRQRGLTVGRLDSRFTGWDRDEAGEAPEFDPSMSGVDVGYVALLNDYLVRELGYETDLPYRALAWEVWPWRWDVENQTVNVAEHLRRAMTANPALRVLFTAGLYDMATPYFDTEYTVDHLMLPEALRDNVEIEHYEAGHMMYIRRLDHEKLERDVEEFIRGATAGAPASPGDASDAGGAG